MPRMALAVLIALINSPIVFAQASASRNPDPDESKASAQSVLPDDAWNSPDIAAPRFAGRPLKRPASKAVVPPATRAGPSAERAWIRPTLALGGVVILIVFLAWGYRGVTAGRLPFVKRARHAALIQVVGRATLSPRQSVCLVRTGPRLVLVGLSNGSMTALDVIDDADLTARLCGEAAAGQPDSHSAQFQRCLEVEAGEYGRGDAPPETAVAEADVDADAKIIQLKQKLAGTIERIRERVRRA